MRVPEGADEICFDISAKLNEGTDTFEFDRFTIYKIGDPLPVWPPGDAAGEGGLMVLGHYIGECSETS